MARKLPTANKQQRFHIGPPASSIAKEMTGSRKQKMSAGTGVSMNNWPTLRKLMERRERSSEKRL